MLTFLALIGSWFIFWPLLILLIVIGGWTAEDEHYVWSFIMTLMIAGLVYLGFPSIVELFSQPMKIVMYVGLYVGIGITWSIAKWYLHLRKTLNTFVEIRDEYLRDHKLPQGFFTEIATSNEDIGHHRDFSSEVMSKMSPHRSPRSSAKETLEIIQPKIWDNKSRVIAWGVYWPTSIVWFVMRDFISEVIETIYNAISGRLQAMSDAMFKNAL